MSRPPAPDLPLRYHRKIVQSVAVVLIMAVLTVIGWFGTQIEDPVGIPARQFHQMSFLMVPGFGLATVLFAYWLAIPFGTVLRIDQSGLTDRRINRKTIPWDQITNIRRTGIYVTLTLNRRFTPSYKLSLRQRILKSRRKSAGPNHVLISVDTLNVTEAELEQRLKSAHDWATGRAPSAERAFSG